MASRRLPFILAMEIESAGWQANSSVGDTQAYPRDEHCQSAVGSASDPWRTPQARRPYRTNERGEWDGPAVLPPLTARRIRWGFQRARGGHAMPSNAETAVARTIGIDTGKNTLHMIGLDEKGAIVLREKVSRTRIAARFVNLPPCLVGIEAGMASHYV